MQKPSHKTVRTESQTDSTVSANVKAEGTHDWVKHDSVGGLMVEYALKRIPSGVKYAGNPVASASWNDKYGKNVLLITETSEIETGNESREKELYAYHYIVNGNESKLLWKIYDYIKDCPVDLTLNYLENSLTITDLNNDGNCESTFIYRLSCKGDVSSDDMKLIMHEGDKKYAIRGRMTLELNGEIFEEGSMNIDKSFDKASSEFRDFAVDEWNKFQRMKLN